MMAATKCAVAADCRQEGSLFFDAATKGQATEWLHGAEIALGAFAVLIVVGVVGEMWGAKTWREIVFGALVALGVFGELLADGVLYVTGDRLQAISDEAINVAGTQAQTAIDRAKQLTELNRQLVAQMDRQRAAIAAAGRETNELSRIVASERALRQPRVLTEAQIREITRAAKAFPKAPFDVVVSTDGEAVNLAGRIIEALKNAGWERKPYSTLGGTLGLGGYNPRVGTGFIATGIIVYVVAAERPKLEPAAIALRNVLNKCAVCMRRAESISRSRTTHRCPST